MHSSGEGSSPMHTCASTCVRCRYATLTRTWPSLATAQRARIHSNYASNFLVVAKGKEEEEEEKKKGKEEKRERKKGKKKGKKSFDYTSINGDRRGFAQTIKFRVQLRLRIYEHERCARARAHETRRTVYFSEYCRGRCAPNDCLSTALRSCSDTWKYSRGRAYRNILVVWWDNRRLTGWSEMRLWEEAWIGSRAGEIAILVSSGWSWNVDEKFLIKVVTYLKKKNSKNYYENIWISLKIF